VEGYNITVKDRSNGGKCIRVEKVKKIDERRHKVNTKLIDAAGLQDDNCMNVYEQVLLAQRLGVLRKLARQQTQSPLIRQSFHPLQNPLQFFRCTGPALLLRKLR
jgi:hypothetical protein